MHKNNSLKIQLLMNLVPLIGVIFANWSVFALIYSYWLETLGIAFFNSIRIVAAQKSGPSPHIFKALRYFGSHLFSLMFYMIFILAFIGFQIAGKQEGVKFANYLLFIDPSFRYAMLTLLLTKSIEFTHDYFLSGQYKETSPDDFSPFFSSRMIIIHVVIVLGVFANQFASESFNAKAGVIAFAAVFVIVKSIADFVIHSLISPAKAIEILKSKQSN